jgi:type III secretion protein F
MITNSSSISGEYINQVGLAALSTREAQLQTAISGVGSSPTTVDMLNLQQQVQQWSMLIQGVSTLYKEVSDALKGVVQKSS